MASNAASTAASSTLNAVKRATNPFPPRSISISVSPAPVSFAERRSVLQVLERYGRVEFFKSVPNHDSMFISLMKDEEAARKLVATSPIGYNVFVPQSSPETLLSSLSPSQTLSKSKPITALKAQDPLTTSAVTPSDQATSDAELPQKEFQIQVFAHPTYRHHASFANKLHMSWPDFVCQNNSFLTRVLKQSLPNKMATKGLANWDPDFGQQQMASDRSSKRQDRVREVAWTPSKLLARARRREEQENAPSNNAPKGKENVPNDTDPVVSPPVSTTPSG